MTLSSSVSRQVNQKNLWFFDSRSNLPPKQNTLWKLESGAARTLTWLEDGTLVVLGLWGAGDVLGKALTKTNLYQIECLTQVQAIPLDLSEVPNITDILLAYIQQLEDFILIRSQKRTEFMLLNLLNWLAQKFGREAENGQLIDLRLTHQDLAEILGSTRVTITRILSQLEQQGVIDRLPSHRFILREEAAWYYEI